MTRAPALAAASLAALVALSAGEAQAQAQAQAQASAAPPARLKASPAERTMAQRLDPLARAAFWAREVNLDPADAEAGVGLAQALRTIGSLDDAVAAAGRVLVAQPEHLDANLELARAHIARNQGFHAIAPAQVAARAAPGDWRPWSLLGVAFEQAQREAEALEAHRRAAHLGAGHAAPLSNLALFLAGRGQTAEAEALLRQAVTLPDATPTVRQNLALVLGLSGRIDEAERLARQDLPPEVVARNLAYLRAAAGSGDPASRSWEAMRAP